MLGWILLIILIAWLILSRRKNTSPKPHNIVPVPTENSSSKKDISEETVYSAQNRFEKKFEEIYLPDSLSGRDIYLYRNIMAKWFFELSAKYRYYDKMIQRLRRDFLDWMYSTEHSRTSSYLSHELESEEERSEYRDEASILFKKAYSIENGFAEAMGGDAKKELDHVRSLDYLDINKHGELAPEGYEFDLSGNLKPKKGDL